jgi:hypothetical protein
MTRPSLRSLVGLALVAALAACGGTNATAGDGGFPSTPLSSVASTGGALNVSVYTAPEQPPVRGVVSIRYVVKEASTGTPVDGLTLELTPWMTAMGHGASVTPTVQALGQGIYDVSNVDMFMPGPWQLRTTFSGSVNDTVNPTVQVQ